MHGWRYHGAVTTGINTNSNLLIFLSRRAGTIEVDMGLAGSRGFGGPGCPSDDFPTNYYFRDCEINTSLVPQDRGFLLHGVELLQETKKGPDIGRRVNLDGEAMGRFCSPHEGSARAVRQWSHTESDEAAIMVARTRRKDPGGLSE